MVSRRAIVQGLLAIPMLRGSDKKTSGTGIKLAIGTYGMKALPARDALRAIAQTGYDGVELCLIAGWPSDPAKLSATDRLELRKLISDSGLALPAMLENLPMIALPSKRAQNLERLKRAVDLANELSPSRPPVVESILGGKSADWEKTKESLAEELKQWARVAESAKVTVCFKPHAAQAVNSPARTLWLLGQVNSPRIKIVYDYSHFSVEGFPLESSLRELLPHAEFLSVKDSAGTPEKHEYLLPGDGGTDYLAYFQLLKKLRYQGFVIVEVSGMIQQRPGYQPVATARVCYDRLAPLMKRAGIRTV